MAYTLSGSCGTVRLDARTTGVVINESVQRTSKVTSNPVEQGSDINDHVVNDPIKFTITGVTINGDGQAALMRRMWNQKDILTYTGRNRISNCVITSLSTTIDAKNANGAKFTMQLQVVNLASSDYVEMGEQLMSAQDAGASTSASSTNQTKATGAEGLKSTVGETISSSAYSAYVKSYQNKPASSSGPNARNAAAFSAA